MWSLEVIHQMNREAYEREKKNKMNILEEFEIRRLDDGSEVAVPRHSGREEVNGKAAFNPANVSRD